MACLNCSLVLYSKAQEVFLWIVDSGDEFLLLSSTYTSKEMGITWGSCISVDSVRLGTTVRK